MQNGPHTVVRPLGSVSFILKLVPVASVTSFLANLWCFSAFSMSRIMIILSLAVTCITPLRFGVCFLVWLYSNACPPENKRHNRQIKRAYLSNPGGLPLPMGHQQFSSLFPGQIQIFSGGLIDILHAGPLLLDSEMTNVLLLDIILPFTDITFKKKQQLFTEYPYLFAIFAQKKQHENPSWFRCRQEASDTNGAKEEVRKCRLIVYLKEVQGKALISEQLESAWYGCFSTFYF